MGGRLLPSLAPRLDLAVPGTAFLLGFLFRSSLSGLRAWPRLSRMGRHREAAAEFQKFLDHPGIVLNDPTGPMARLQLARALSASGDRAKSAAVYKDLLTQQNVGARRHCLSSDTARSRTSSRPAPTPACVRLTGTVGRIPTPWCWLPSCFSTFMPVHVITYPPGKMNGLTSPLVPAVASPRISPSL